MGAKIRESLSGHNRPSATLPRKRKASETMASRLSVAATRKTVGTPGAGAGRHPCLPTATQATKQQTCLASPSSPAPDHAISLLHLSLSLFPLQSWLTIVSLSLSLPCCSGFARRLVCVFLNCLFTYSSSTLVVCTLFHHVACARTSSLSSCHGNLNIPATKELAELACTGAETKLHAQT